MSLETTSSELSTASTSGTELPHTLFHVFGHSPKTQAACLACTFSCRVCIDPSSDSVNICNLFSEGSASLQSDWSDVEYRIKPQQGLLVPMMLSPPESLLVACILRGNFIEAHQVTR